MSRISTRIAPRFWITADGWASDACCGLAFGGAERSQPLLVSVRSGAPVSMPGMMDTVLNVGLYDRTVGGLLRLTGNPRLVWDSYRRLVQQYARVAHGADAAASPNWARHARQGGRVERAAIRLRQPGGTRTDGLQAFADLTGAPFPQDPMDQLDAAVGAVLQSAFASRRGVPAVARHASTTRWAPR